MRRICDLLFLLLLFPYGCDYRYDGISYDDIGDGFYIIHDRGRPYLGKEVRPGSQSYTPTIFPYVKQYATNKDFILISRQVTEHEYRDKDGDSAWLVENNNDSLQFFQLLKIRLTNQYSTNYLY